MFWIHLAQGRDEWKAVVNVVIKFTGSVNLGKFSSSCPSVGFSRRTRPMELVIS
jgi:hypothetical protein